MVEYAYNNTVHTSTGKTPFEIVEGRRKVPPILRMKGDIFATDEYVCDINDAFQKVRDAIKASQEKQKRAVNKHRRPLEFKEEAWVLFKFPKARLRQRTKNDRDGVSTGHQKYYAKLAKRYYGPFQI